MLQTGQFEGHLAVTASRTFDVAVVEENVGLGAFAFAVGEGCGVVAGHGEVPYPHVGVGTAVGDVEVGEGACLDEF